MSREAGVGAWTRRWLPLAALLGSLAAYYAVFFLPPRLVGGNEADRYYHLALSRMIAEGGLPRVLPQVEDLGWGHYFPDKEFLFHALTALAWKLGGDPLAIMVVPLLGLAIAATLYLSMPRKLSGVRAATIVAVAILLGSVFLFRLTLLRPHLLAILCFCVLVAGLLRGRNWMSMLGAAGFALSYHALYLPLFAIGVAACVPWTEHRHRRWLLPAAALLVAVVVNPYFPGSVVIGWQVLKLALGIDIPPGWMGGAELHTEPTLYLEFFGYLPVFILIAAVVLYRQRKRAALSPEQVFVFALSALLVALSLKSSRATEYAIPSVVLLAGELAALVPSLRAFAATALAMALMQLYGAAGYYADIWVLPQGGATGFYLEAIGKIPADAHGAKVFNCEWEAGSYLLYARPDLRFVDLLEPALLWYRSHDKYVERLRIARGLETHPEQGLARDFDADYVLCADPRLLAQMSGDRAHFEELGAEANPAPIRTFRLVGKPQ